MNVSARFKVDHVDDHGTHKEVFMSPIYSSDPNSPNYSYSKATPSGKMQLLISNPAAFNQFKGGMVIDIVMTEAPAEAQQPPVMRATSQ